MKYKNHALPWSATSSCLVAKIGRYTLGSIVLSCLAFTTIISPAEESIDYLPDTTIIANRATTPLDQVGSSVSILQPDGLSEAGIRSLDDALKFVPGVISDSVGGQRGSSSDLYIRGLRTTHTHIVVDGMRISDTNSGFILSKQFLGSGNLSGLSRLEVLRGPQGALYGGDSIAGVLGLYSKKGQGGHRGSLQAEAGSFNTGSSSLALDGSAESLSYSLSLGHETTDNDLPDNRFEMLSHALRLDYDLSRDLSIGMTLRGADATYEGPQTGPFYSGPDNSDFRYTLATLFADYQINDIWSSKLTLGIYEQDSDFISRAATPAFGNPGDLFYDPGSQPPTISYANEESLTKYGAYWDNTLRWNRRHTTIAGLVYEKSDYVFTDIFDSYDARERKQHGLYANHIWNITDQFTVSGGFRWEDYSDDGDNGFNDDVYTWRVASAYTCEQSNTTFRASLGHGFRIPNTNELNGNPAFGIAPNRNLDPVESLGWDFGIEQSFCDERYKVSITYFANQLENAIIGTGTSYINAEGTSETSGIEASAEANLLQDRLSILLTYTWLDRSLVDMPENAVALRIQGKVTDKLHVGLTGFYLDSRSYGGNSLPSYSIINLFGNHRITDEVSLNMRIENLFDEDYNYFTNSFSTYPGRGRGIFAGLTIQW